MTKDEFIAKFADELTGLLLASFAQMADRQKVPGDDKSNAADGRFMIQQMRKARDLLARMHEAIHQEPKK